MTNHSANHLFKELILEINQHYQLQLPSEPTSVCAFLDESGIYFQLEQINDGVTLSAHIRDIHAEADINLLNALALNNELILSGLCLAVSSDHRTVLLLQHLTTNTLDKVKLEQWLLPFITKARLLKKLDNF